MVLTICGNKLYSVGSDVLARPQEVWCRVRKRSCSASLARSLLGPQRGRLPGSRHPHYHRQLPSLQDCHGGSAEDGRRTSIQVICD